MRRAFSDTLIALADRDERLLLLTGDHGYSLFDAFRERHPDRYLNAGIAEQNMVGMAAGLARQGFRPFVYGLSAFVPIRVLEQIKLDIAHDDLPVVLIGDGAGFVYSHLGTSHQATEDIACARVIPGLAVLSPADRHELAACMMLAHARSGPTYLRIGKSDRGDVHTAALAAPPTTPLRVRQGSGGMTILATGPMVRTALDIADARFTDAAVWSIPQLKPFDAASLLVAVEQAETIVTIEEHSIYGGLGALIAEVVSEAAPKRILRVGVRDRFSERCGSYDYLLREHGLDLASIGERIAAFVG